MPLNPDEHRVESPARDAAMRWLLRAAERGNVSTTIDAANPNGDPWTEGNMVRFHVDGASYFERLQQVLSTMRSGDEVRFTDWRGDADEQLSDLGVTIATLLSDACLRGVDVRGLLWRSHSDRLSFSAKDNRMLSNAVGRAGGEVLLDERVRRGGSHHQKLVVLRFAEHPERDVAFVGGIDLSHGRRDTQRHLGDAQAIPLDARYGSRPPWHDVHLEVRGPAVGALDDTFRERWEDPTPLNHASRLRGLLSSRTGRDRIAAPLPPRRPTPSPQGHQAVQVLRTYPSVRPRYPFAADGERSVARAFSKAVERARTLIYIEDQYFWSHEVARRLAAALRRQPQLQLVVVLPRYPDKDGSLSGPPARLAQRRAIEMVTAAGGERVGVYDLENDAGCPVYVHAKVCIIDDVWASVGSDNLNRRSWTHDSEVACAVLDRACDPRDPPDPGGQGDGARVFARELRLALWAEHLGRRSDDPALVEIGHAAALWRDAAATLHAWKANPEDRSRPPVRVVAHAADGGQRQAQWARAVYRLIFDPDGRPLRLRLRRTF
jgi:phosphatidylserine/phosphatidylglycerophosphate/cardiolipin synthase-like enzyme